MRSKLSIESGQVSRKSVAAGYSYVSKGLIK